MKEKIKDWLKTKLPELIKSKLQSVIDKIKSKFNIGNKEISINPGDKKVMDYIYDKTNSPTHEMMLKMDYSNLGEVEIVNPDKKKTILTLDDILYTDMLYREDVRKIKEKYGLDVYNDYKVVRCLGPNAGLLAYKYFIIDKNPCDYGILDITLGQQINVTGSWFMELDGIDIAKYILELNPNFKFVLCTAHTINKTNYIVNTYNNKCKKVFGKELDAFYLNKNSERFETIYKLLK